MDDKNTSRLVIVSNRLPLKLEKKEGKWEVTPSSGGLVSALNPILKNRGGIWIGWTGTTEHIGTDVLRQILGPASREAGYRTFPVRLSAEEVSKYYYGFSNEVLWPLFHDLQSHCNFEPEYWNYYRQVNEKFARAVSRYSREEDFIWVHDYQLISVASKLKKLKVKRRSVFFLHIPFPPLDIFLKLPWRTDLLKDFLEYDFIAFQTARDRRNFVDCLRAMFRGTRTKGRGPIVTVHCMDRKIKVGELPISIDYRSFTRLAASEEVKDLLKEQRKRLHRNTVILGVDRLDYTKGIPERLRAYQMTLRKYPELRENITLVQIVVPSREEVPAYKALRERIEQLVSAINGEFTTPGWVPVHYMHKSVTKTELVSLYRLADIALVTPLKDGMNLVAKEYCTCQIDNKGVLILSEFAGSAAQMQKDAVMVNSYDIEGIADAIYNAVYMQPREKHDRMRRLRRNIRRRDVFWWVDNYLRAATGRALVDFPESEMAPILHAIQPQGPRQKSRGFGYEAAEKDIRS